MAARRNRREKPLAALPELGGGNSVPFGEEAVEAAHARKAAGARGLLYGAGARRKQLRRMLHPPLGHPFARRPARTLLESP